MITLGLLVAIVLFGWFSHKNMEVTYSFPLFLLTTLTAMGLVALLIVRIHNIHGEAVGQCFTFVISP